MRGRELAEAMAVAVDHLVSACEGTSALDRAIETTVYKIGQFSGKDATSYLETYKSEMQMRNIPEDRRLSGFPRVVTPSIHTEVIEVQAGCRDWADFAEQILYSFDDLLRLLKRRSWIGLASLAKVGTHLRSFRNSSLGSCISSYWTGNKQGLVVCQVV